MTKPTDSGLMLSLGEILDLYNVGIGNLALGHAGLNGYNKAVGDRIMLQPFSLTDEIRQRIVKNKFILRPYFEEIDRDLRQKITGEVMEDAEAVAVPPEDWRRQGAWARRYTLALRTTHTVGGLYIFERSDLFHDNRNPIPNETEAALGPIIKGSPWRESRKLDGEAG